MALLCAMIVWALSLANAAKEVQAADPVPMVIESSVEIYRANIAQPGEPPEWGVYWETTMAGDSCAKSTSWGYDVVNETTPKVYLTDTFTNADPCDVGMPPMRRMGFVHITEAAADDHIRLDNRQTGPTLGNPHMGAWDVHCLMNAEIEWGEPSDGSDPDPSQSSYLYCEFRLDKFPGAREVGWQLTASWESTDWIDFVKFWAVDTTFRGVEPRGGWQLLEWQNRSGPPQERGRATRSTLRWTEDSLISRRRTLPGNRVVDPWLVGRSSNRDAEPRGAGWGIPHGGDF
jgi:hypothetical protein